MSLIGNNYQSQVWHSRRCGCYYLVPINELNYQRNVKHYLPIVKVNVHSNIVSSTSHTVLTQTFKNKDNEAIKKCIYDFPLYDGVSVVSFVCHIGSRKIKGVVHEKTKSKEIFDAAVAKGQTAALLEQSTTESDLFTTTLGNVPAGETVQVEITYVGDLKHDAEADGIRFTIPTFIAPRYGQREGSASDWGGARAGNADVALDMPEGMSITIDVNMADGSPVKAVQSPSHPIEVSLGVTSTNLEADAALTKASATLALGNAGLEKDFVLIVKAKNTETPKAILESHPTIADHRALMLTLVPKFVLSPIRPEIVFVVDRSGSMGGEPIQTVVAAMRVFLKSLPPGVMFNICSFGSHHSFFFEPKSKKYTNDTLEAAMAHADSIRADYGGTETLSAIKSTIERRYGDIPLEIILLTDGDIRAQQGAFEYVNEQVSNSRGQIRVFPLGIGHGVSHSLIEGLARAGKGFAQSVQTGERLDARLVRMLKGALSPHITDYSLEVQYGEEDGFELVDAVTESMNVLTTSVDPGIPEEKENSPAPSPTKKQRTDDDVKTKISLFDTATNLDMPPSSGSEPRLPYVHPPTVLQAPIVLPALFPFNRTTAYLLLSPESIQRNPVAVVLRGTAPEGQLELRIPISALDQPGTTIHALAARKAAQDLEEGRGWLHEAKDKLSGSLIKTKFASRFEKIVEREAVRLGTTFQVVNRWCSFVAVDENTSTKVNEGDGTYLNEPQHRGSTATLFGNIVSTNPLWSSLLLSADRRFLTRGPRGNFGGSKRGLDTANSEAGSTKSGATATSDDEVEIPKHQLRELAATTHYGTEEATLTKSQSSSGPGLSQPLSSTSMKSSTRSGNPTGGMPRIQMMQMSQMSQMSSQASLNNSRASYQCAREEPTGSSRMGGNHAFGRGGGTHAFGRGGGNNSFDSSTRGGQARPPAPGGTFYYSAASYSAGPSHVDLAHDQSHTFGNPTSVEIESASADENLSAADKVRMIIDLQKFDGCWEPSKTLAALLGVALERITVKEAGGKRDRNEQKVWATILVLSLLEKDLQSEEEVWEMVVDKAKVWLDSQVKGWTGLKSEAAATFLAGT